MALHAVILAGGSGTRFWPLSTPRRPKHLLALVGARTMLEETAARLRGLVPPSRTLVVTAAAQAAAVRRLLPGIAVLAEPRPRNTSAAVALAAARIAARDPGAVLVVVSADHWIPDASPFRRTMAAAAARARDARTLLLVGVRPDRPATGYGYLLPGARIRGTAVRPVREFTEKPDLPTARRWLRDGRRLWNSGMFAWRADVLLEEVRRHLPDLHRVLVASGAATAGGAALARAYARVPSISVDYGVLERSDRVECVAAEFRWDDLGSFAALLRRRKRDGSGNAARGEVRLLDCRDVLAVAPPGRRVSVLGVRGLAVVATEDEVLVLPLDRSEEVRRLADARPPRLRR